MKFFTFAIFVLVAAVATINSQAQAVPAATSAVKQALVRGYGQFDVAPPHNEVPAICGLAVSTETESASKNDHSCSAFARYIASGHIEIMFFSRMQHVPVLRNAYLFGDSTFLFGNTIPQQKYTWSANPIGWDSRAWGVALIIPKGFELRVEQNFPFKSFKDCTRERGYTGPNGMKEGRSNFIGVRKYFGYRGGGGPH